MRGPVGTPWRGTSSLTGRSASTVRGPPAAPETSARRANQNHGTQNENGRVSRCSSRYRPSGESITL